MKRLHLAAAALGGSLVLVSLAGLVLAGRPTPGNAAAPPASPPGDASAGPSAEVSAESPVDPSADRPADARVAEPADTPSAGRAQPMLPSIEVLVGGVPLIVEIASGGEQRYRGLSFRETLDENAGMLFVYPAARMLTFTMRDTLLPLSIAFIGDDLVVQEIIDMNVGPGQLFDAARPARYALEVNQGWFERNGVGPGAQVAMP